jgi:predicted amidohydrolase
MKIAISQIWVSDSQEDEQAASRLDSILETIAQAADEADVICFPEYFLGKLPPEPMPNAALLAIQDVARLAGINVVCGIARDLRRQEGNYLTSLVINRNGHIIASVDKTCLYPAEQLWYRAGHRELFVELDEVGVGILAGFDLLRADLARDAVRRGAQILIAQFAADTPAYLDTLRAVIVSRALEYLVPVVAVGQLGEFFGREYIGGSTVAQPTLTDGNMPGPVAFILEMGNEEDMWIVDLDLDSFREMRRRFSYFELPRTLRE